MEIKLTKEQQKTLTIFTYYCRGFGGNEVTRSYFFQSGSEEWSEDNWVVPYGSDIESYDAIDELIDTLIEDNDLTKLSDDDNFLTLEFEIDCTEKVLSIRAWEKIIEQEYSSSMIDSSESKELKKYCYDMISQGFLTGVINFEGVGDNGAVEDHISLFGKSPSGENFQLLDEQVNDDIEGLCYTMLEEYPGWEINDGSQGQFELDFKEGTINLKYGQNLENDMAIDFRVISKF